MSKKTALQQNNLISKRRHGFTLIELIVTIVIIGIVSSAVFLRSPGQTSFEVDAWAETLVRDIRYTQTLSMSLNKRYSIKFDTTSYTIQDENTQPHQHPASEFNFVSLPSGMTMKSSLATVVFSGAGVPNNSNGRELSQTTTITLQSGQESTTITIAPQTGFTDE